MNTINIEICGLVATAEDGAMVVSDNTGYQLHFEFDGLWNDDEIKTALLVWRRDSLFYSQPLPFSGDTVTLPRIPPVDKLLVGVMAGDLQTTTPAEIECKRSILSCGGEEPEPPTESVYAQLMALIRGTYGASAYELAQQHGYKGTEIQWLASLRGEQGPQGIPGVQGPQGPAGRTPVRGVDYFTEADREELVQAVLAALPNGDEVCY